MRISKLPHSPVTEFGNALSAREEEALNVTRPSALVSVRDQQRYGRRSVLTKNKNQVRHTRSDIV